MDSCVWQCACLISVWEAVHDMCFVHRQFVDERWSLWLLFVFHLQLLKVQIVVKERYVWEDVHGICFLLMGIW